MSAAVKTFPAVEGDDFGAQSAAEAWLKARGFSWGSSQHGAPQAIWYGACSISKWRNLSAQEQRDAHAVMEGGRSSDVRITLRKHAPADAVLAFCADDEVVT